MDLITGLSKSRGYHAILTIVDHGCSRGAIFLPCTTTITGLQIAKLYLDNVFHWFRLPKRIISDRDPRFTSHFGKAITTELGISQNLSTAFHPQTDGLSEQKNQWIEQYLHLTMANQDEWSRWLSITTLIHNNSVNSTTGLAPFQLLIGWEPLITQNQIHETNNQTAEQMAEQLEGNRQLAVQALNHAANTKGILESQYHIGQKVWLEAKNLPLQYGSLKLAPRHHRPFQIIREISPVAYQLDLPHQWNIHPVFHVSLLTPFIETDLHGPNFSRPPPNLIKGEAEYKVEDIRNHQQFGKNKRLQYLLKWKGYPESDNTWEPAEQLHVPQILKRYHAKTPLERTKVILITQTPHHPLPHHPSWSSTYMPSLTSPSHFPTCSQKLQCPITLSMPPMSLPTRPHLTLCHCPSPSIRLRL
jgi:Chromo (CHRromatin Organisation MOdifier) domain